MKTKDSGGVHTTPLHRGSGIRRAGEGGTRVSTKNNGESRPHKMLSTFKYFGN